MKTLKERPDLSKKQLIALLVMTLFLSLIAFSLGRSHQPGTPLTQSAAILGAVLLCAPFLFFIVKRSGKTQSPPIWFIVHVLSSAIGSIFIVFHASSGDWFGPAGFLLLIMLILVFQGFFARIYTARLYAHLFAQSSSSFNFTDAITTDRTALKEIINQKRALLKKLDSDAEEALFSPNLFHWMRTPILTYRYTILLEREAQMVGARQRSGIILGWWRRIHMLLAALFLGGLLLHLIVVLFFAGYVAGDSEIYWWHIATWGR